MTKQANGIRNFALLAGLASLLGCATPPRAGEDVAAITARLGKPALIIKLASGERWFYPSGPSGISTLAVDVDSDRVIAARNVLTDDTIQQIAAGQTADEVLARIGPPYRRVRFDNIHATAWDYLFQDTWGYRVKLAVMIGDDGRVSQRIAERIEPARNH